MRATTRDCYTAQHNCGRDFWKFPQNSGYISQIASSAMLLPITCCIVYGRASWNNNSHHVGYVTLLVWDWGKHDVWRRKQGDITDCGPHDSAKQVVYWCLSRSVTISNCHDEPPRPARCPVSYHRMRRCFCEQEPSLLLSALKWSNWCTNEGDVF